MFEELFLNFTAELERYNKEFDKGVFNQAYLSVAATAYVLGVYQSTQWGFGEDAAKKILDTAMEYKFVEGQTLTGLALPY